MEYVVPLQVIARKLSLDLGIDCNISSDPNFHKKWEVIPTKVKMIS